VRVKATIQVNGQPLRNAYIEHLVMGVGTNMYMTDTDGQIRDENRDKGIDSFTSNADIRIICQNPIVRVVDGKNWTIGVYQDKPINDGDTVNLNTDAEQRDWYNILNRAQIAYEVAFKPLSFFKGLPNPDFPLGRLSSLRKTRDQAKRIDLSYPDQFPNQNPFSTMRPLTFVEPKRLGDNFPFMHVKDKSLEPRLFGMGGAVPMIVPHELTHALHFSFLSEQKRGHTQDAYIGFIIESLAAGGSATHNFTVRTTPEVAYIEAGGWYAENFTEFMRARQGGTMVMPEAITPAIQAQFVAAEVPLRLAPLELPGPRPVLTAPGFPALGGGGGVTAAGTGPRPALDIHILHKPVVTEDDVEGAVYSAIFVDFASRVGLDLAASSYFAANALTFGEYETFIKNTHPELTDTIASVRKFWKL
jgi:hypothetical protein